jgi:TRAP transporter TAXI family solute receptor
MSQGALMGMNGQRIRLVSAWFLVLLGWLGTACAQVPESFLIIGTGGVTAVYYPSGGAICRVVGMSVPGTRCLVQSTGGSIDNIEHLRNGDIQFGFAQSDWQYHAFRGTDRFSARGPFTDLRAVFSLHAEPFTIVARAETGVRKFDDLRGKRVNIGNPGSGQRGTMEVVIAAKGWSLDAFGEIFELTSVDQAEALCTDRVDAIAMTVGHPSASIQKATMSCGGTLVDVSGPAIDRLVDEHPYYRHAKIPAGMYNNEHDILTFGVAATVVTSAAVPDDVVYTVVRAVFEQLDTFRALHPALGHLEPDEMVQAGISIPLHPGAERYYREVGLLPGGG